MNCMRRFTNAITEDAYMVYLGKWEKEQDFAKKVIEIFNYNTSSQGCAPKVIPMGNWPTGGYLNDMTRQFMMKRYSWTVAKEYRQWCKENPGKILVVEVFGELSVPNPTALEMKYDKGFWFNLA